MTTGRINCSKTRCTYYVGIVSILHSRSGGSLGGGHWGGSEGGMGGIGVGGLGIGVGGALGVAALGPRTATASGKEKDILLIKLSKEL